MSFKKFFIGEVMKATLLAVLFLANFQNAFAGSSANLQLENCLELTNDVSAKAFSRMNNLKDYDDAHIKSDDQFKYIQDVQDRVYRDMKEVCASTPHKVSIEKFKEKYNGICKIACDREADRFKKSVLLPGMDKKTYSQNDCMSVCDKTYAKLEYLEKGMQYRSADIYKGSPDCTGAVSDSGRDKSKEKVDSWGMGLFDSKTDRVLPK